MTSAHLAFSDSEVIADRPTSPSNLMSTAKPESSQDMVYTVAARKIQAQVIGELVRHGLGRLRGALRSAWRWHLQHKAERRTIATLQGLDNHLLRDIGVNRYDLAAQVHARLSHDARPVSIVTLDSRRPTDESYQPTERAA